ncbi:DUF4261 domain-containing protein [Roseateles chitinivorans]|uniref:DUF4261 domain-containing protein n=1 Tax=Roseateles chitinivorans TaxID=2917965 RepID=UPI003D66A46F
MQRPFPIPSPIDDSSAEAAEGANSALTFVLLREARLPDAQTVQTRLERRLDGRLEIDSLASGERSEDGVILFRIGGGTAAVGLIDAPLPEGEIDDLCAAAWFWESARVETDRHRAHLAVTVMGSSLDRLDVSLLLTDLVAAVMEDNDNAIASYWRAALRPRDMFLEASESASRTVPPVWLWVDFRFSQSDMGVSLSTDGLRAYGLRELEVRDAKQPPMEVFDLFADTAAYLIASGPVIEDGHTIGASPELGIVVHHDKSYWEDGANVYRVVWTK